MLVNTERNGTKNWRKLCPRVCEFVDRGEAFAGDVRIDLRGAEAGVPQDLLHGSEVGTAIDQVTNGDKERRIFLRADKTVDYGQFMTVMKPPTPATRNAMIPPATAAATSTRSRYR